MSIDLLNAVVAWYDVFTSVAYSIITRIFPTVYFEILHVCTDTFNNFSRNLALILEVFGNCDVVLFFFFFFFFFFFLVQKYVVLVTYYYGIW